MPIITRMSFLVSLFLISLPAVSRGEFYEWKDADGGVHFSDSLESVPAKYRSQLIRRDMPEDTETIQPAVKSEKVTDKPQEKSAGTDAKQRIYWQGRFQKLRSEIDRLKKGIPGKQEEINQLRHKWVTSLKRTDRSALNQKEDELAADGNRIKELEKQLEELDIEAAQNAVPLEWRK